MNLKDYIRFRLDKKDVDLKDVYKEMMRRGFNPREIYTIVNEIVLENITKITEDYKRRNKK